MLLQIFTAFSSVRWTFLQTEKGNFMNRPCKTLDNVRGFYLCYPPHPRYSTENEHPSLLSHSVLFTVKFPFSLSSLFINRKWKVKAACVAWDLSEKSSGKMLHRWVKTRTGSLWSEQWGDISMYNLVWSAIFVISTSWIWDVVFKVSVTISGKEKKKKRLEYDILNDTKNNYLKYLFLQLLQT